MNSLLIWCFRIIVVASLLLVGVHTWRAIALILGERRARRALEQALRESPPTEYAPLDPEEVARRKAAALANGWREDPRFPGVLTHPAPRLRENE